MGRKSYSLFTRCASAAVMSAVSICGAATYHVSLDGDDANDGKSWSAPKRTIQAALDCAKIWKDKVIISNGVYELSGKELVPGGYGTYIQSLTLDPKDVVIDAKGLSRCFNGGAIDGYNYTFTGLTFRNGMAEGHGGGIYAGSLATVTDCIFTNCTATGRAGGCYLLSHFPIKGCKFYDCHSTAGSYDGGGGLYIYHGSPVTNSEAFVSNCFFSGCSAVNGNGGGLISYDASIFDTVVTNCTARYGGALRINDMTDISAVPVCDNLNISDCHAMFTSGDCMGGGIDSRGAVIRNSIVENCSVSINASSAGYLYAKGGGIYGVWTQVSNCIVRGCSTVSFHTNHYNWSVAGGGIFLYEQKDATYEKLPVSIRDCEIYGCIASNAYNGALISGGGGLFADGAAITVSDVLAHGNFVCEGGGGIFVKSTSDGTSVIEYCTVTNNTLHAKGNSAMGGAGIRTMEKVLVKNCLIANNDGGDHFVYNGSGSAFKPGSGTVLIDSAVLNNSAGARSGVCFAHVSNITISNCVFSGNVQTVSTGRGGLIGVYDPSGTLLITDCYIVDNDFSDGELGGLVYLIEDRSSENTAWNFIFRNNLVARNKFRKGALFAYLSGRRTSVGGYTGIRIDFENCTFAENSCSTKDSTMFFPYTGDTPGSHCTQSNTFMTGCAFFENTYGSSLIHSYWERTTNINWNLLVKMPQGGVGNQIYDPARPMFINAEAGDYRPAAGSQLCNAVPPQAWMGEDRKMGPDARLDLGSGYKFVSAGKYGISVVRLNASARLVGGTADIGCCERMLPGFMMIMK